MNYQSKLTNYLKWFVFLILMNYSIQSSAQCAGSDTSVTVCEKDSDAANQTFNLFDILVGESTGGTWSTDDPVNLPALEANTGMLDLWKINNFGTHDFTYTNNTCGESATVTINLGGYPGENNTDGSANACGDVAKVNLHGFLGSNTDGKIQDFNGTWSEVPAGRTGNLSDSNFNAQASGPGVYTFTYTVDAIMDGATVLCASRTSTIEVEVYDPRTAGVGSSLSVCTDEDLSGYTDFDLHDLLAGESMLGTWEQLNSYGQITGTADNTVNVQELRDLSPNGGSYTFTYNAPRSHPVCSDSSAEVTIIVLPALHETLSSPNYCLGETYTIDVAYDNTLLPASNYEIEYSLNDGITTTQQLDTIPFNAGAANFEIISNLVTPNVEYEVTISSIRTLVPSTVCHDIPTPGLSFIVSNTDADISDVCITTDGSVDLTNILDDTKILKNGAYDVTYILTDSGTVQTTFTATAVNFIDGDATFAIPAANLTTLGNYSIEISVANELINNCVLAATFELLPTPSDITLDLAFDNSCNTSNIDVIVDAPVISTGDYTITYEVTALGDTTVLLSNTETTTGTTQTYPFDVSSLADGNYTATVTSTQSDTTPCRTVYDFSHSIDFARGGISLPPTATVDQTFCTEDFGITGPTIADILLTTAAGTIRFYDTATDTTILPDNTVLVDGEDYYVATIDLNFTCQESARIQINVTVANPQVPTTTNATPIFCATDNPTVADLDAQVMGTEVLVWYDAATAGNIVDATTVLVDGQTYFAESEINNACQSTTRLEITPTVVGLTEAALSATTLSLCQIDQPTVSELIALENNTGWDVQWYTTSTDGTPLSATDLLVSGTSYYAESYHVSSGCIIPIRVEVTINLSDCDPEAYDYYIPDGFSPNADGRNDTYFVPNIEIIFPEFTMEILNRYGNTLFTGDINNPAWDGSNNGSSIAPNGVYFYIINYNKEGFTQKQGRLYLNR